MILKCRLTHDLAEITADEIETTLFKIAPLEVIEMIENLEDIIEDLKTLI